MTVKCENCHFEVHIPFKIPVLDYPNNIPKKCIQCGENRQGIVEKHTNAVKIEIQDSDTFSEIEKLSCILFDEYTTDIQIGSKVIVAGSIQIIKQKNKKSIPFIYASSIHYENTKNLQLSDKDIDTIHKFKELKNGSLIEALTKMFAPSIIGLDIVKKGILLSAVSSSEGPNLDENRDRIHVLLVGNPSSGKSKLTKESVKRVPNSRYESSQHASGKSLTAIVTKEDEDFCLRIGPVPLAREAICVLNEIGRTTPEDQGFLLDVMEEGEFTINKYGINAKIRSPTVIIASANPINPVNGMMDEKIDMNKIPLIKPIVDRFDLLFVVKDSTDEGAVRAYADKKTKQLMEKIPEYYPYLKKHIAYAKQLKPTLNEESRALINEYYVNLFNSSKFDLKFKSKRILDTLVRITKSFAKLRLKNMADVQDTREALEFFNAMIYHYTEATVSISGDPKNIAISVFTEILKSSSFAYSLEELSKNACKKNDYVKSYLLGTNKNNNNSYPLLKIESNRKLRGICKLLIENTHIARIKEKPIVLQWINSKSLSDISDTTDIPSKVLKNKISDNEPSNADKTMSDMSDMSDTLIETENYKAMHNSTSSNNEGIAEILKSEPKIGYTKPFYYCKEHPKVQNINHEEIKNHIQYSKEHQST